MKSIILLCALSLLFAERSYSQPGKLDSSFGKVGWVEEDFVKVNFYYESVLQAFLHKNGSYDLLIGGLNGGANALARFLPNGTLDKRFANEGYLFVTYMTVLKAVEQEDGKIIIAGTKYNDESAKNMNMVRYNPDGSFDPTFGQNGKVGAGFGISSFYVQNDGKILVIGGTRQSQIIRFNKDGSPDETFKREPTFNPRYSFIYIFQIKETGKLLVTGTFLVPSSCDRCVPTGTAEPVLLRLNEDGTLDPEFGNAGKTTIQLGISAQQSDDKIIVASTKNDALFLTRYNTDGSTDPSFKSGGEQTAGLPGGMFPTSMVIQNDGKILIAGSRGGNRPETSKDFALIRYNKDGTLDNSFDEDGKVVTDFRFNAFANSVAVRPNGKIMVAGGTTGLSNWDYALAWYNGDGSADDKFHPQGKQVAYVPVGMGSLVGIAVQPDGKKVVAGLVYDSLNRMNFFVARYSADGQPDKTFGENGKQVTDFGYSYSILSSVALQKDGKIVLAGSVVISGGYPASNLSYFAVARYSTDGKPDSTFSEDGRLVTSFGEKYLFNDVSSLAIQEDGKLLVGGSLINLEFKSSVAVARYNTNGSLDESFGTNGKQIINFSSDNDYAFALAIQQDQKIIIAGTTFSNGTNDFGLARLNQDGKLDNSFGSGGKQITDIAGKNDGLRSVAIQKDGKIIAAGNINIDDINYDVAITRYNSDGSLDKTFDSDGKVTIDFGYNDGANSVNIQADGKIIVTGSSFNGSEQIGNDILIARCNSDGTMDETFGINGKVTTDLGGYDHADGATIANNRLYVTGNRQIVAYDLTGFANLPPVVIISTLNNIVTYSSPAKIKMSATVDYRDGTIRKVEFFAGATLLKTDRKSPYNFSWKNISPGTYTLTAKATGSKGISSSSSPLIVEVTEELQAVVSSLVNNRSKSIAEATNESVNITISPNPTRGILVIRTGILERDRPTNISIIAASGAIVQTIRSKTTQAVIQLDLGSFASGVYTVKIDTGNKTYYSKFIKL